jgi:hypothetical protein
VKLLFNVYKSESVDGLSVETVARDGNCLFQRFHAFVSYEMLKNNVGLHIYTREDCKICMEIKYSVLW